MLSRTLQLHPLPPTPPPKLENLIFLRRKEKKPHPGNGIWFVFPEKHGVVRDHFLTLLHSPRSRKSEDLCLSVGGGGGEAAAPILAPLPRRRGVDSLRCRRSPWCTCHHSSPGQPGLVLHPQSGEGERIARNDRSFLYGKFPTPTEVEGVAPLWHHPPSPHPRGPHPLTGSYNNSLFTPPFSPLLLFEFISFVLKHLIMCLKKIRTP